MRICHEVHGCMNKIYESISDTISRMKPFHKIQVLSAFAPFYSSLFVILTTYIVCWKNKIPFLSFIICFFIYGTLLSFAFNLIGEPIFKYIVGCVISLVGNYCLVSIQMKKT